MKGVKIATEHMVAYVNGKTIQRESVKVPAKRVRGTLVMIPEMRKKSISSNSSL